jgi:hypothetical protein
VQVIECREIPVPGRWSSMVIFVIGLVYQNSHTWGWRWLYMGGEGLCDALKWLVGYVGGRS